MTHTIGNESMSICVDRFSVWQLRYLMQQLLDFDFVFCSYWCWCLELLGGMMAARLFEFVLLFLSCSQDRSVCFEVVSSDASFSFTDFPPR
mmetsp:Transcript_9973/g.17701  ORF Transcript_9973/g.17701 Transcript_9973/m.17701 type:complete len:91 (-) Transcript_9973:492-764(-)